MRTAFRALDALLRGDANVSQGIEGSGGAFSSRVFGPWAVVLGATYGFFMGWYAFTVEKAGAVEQVFASMVKLPALFLLTLAVTFPSLYVFNALVGCRLSFAATLRLLLAAVVVNLAVAASLGPILGFFTLSTSSYPFMILLNVVLLGIAGCIGLAFLLRSLRVLAYAASGATETGEGTGSAAGTIFRVWVVIYALVGAQMGWILRPFIGHPGLPFEWFRPRSGNFFLAVVQALRALVGDAP